ncbi:MAG: hypothetical protein RQ862_03395 [Candidatus Caldarchaeales archaeon]|jgi:hypothetical protein|nr:hypothetical protein [Candidatus Caldarchaeales archaeon]
MAAHIITKMKENINRTLHGLAHKLKKLGMITDFSYMVSPTQLFSFYKPWWRVTVEGKVFECKIVFRFSVLRNYRVSFSDIKIIPQCGAIFFGMKRLDDLCRIITVLFLGIYLSSRLSLLTTPSKSAIAPPVLLRYNGSTAECLFDLKSCGFKDSSLSVIVRYGDTNCPLIEVIRADGTVIATGDFSNPDEVFRGVTLMATL